MNLYIKTNTLTYLTVKAALICLFVICLAACPPEPDNDISIGEITIYNIPFSIEVAGKPGTSNHTYKIYVNASNYMDEDKPPAAQGFVIVTSDMLDEVTNRYTVKIPLRTPKINLKPNLDGTPNMNNPPGHIYDPEQDPNEDLGPWKGTANFFSVLISPKNVETDGVNAIWAKGSMDSLNKSVANLDWNALMDFRNPELIELIGGRSKALFDDIVKRDPNIDSN